MATTTYTIEVVDGVYVETDSAFRAQLGSEIGCRVTAVTEGDA